MAQGKQSPLLILAEQARAAKAKEEAEDREYVAFLERRIARVKEWAKKQSRANLEDFLAMAVVRSLEKNRTERVTDKMVHAQGSALDIECAKSAAALSIARDELRKTFTERARRSLGAKRTNAPMDEIRAIVRKRWDALPLQEKTRRGAVLRFATSTASQVTGTSVDGIRRWVAQWRKEPSKR